MRRGDGGLVLFKPRGAPGVEMPTRNLSVGTVLECFYHVYRHRNLKISRLIDLTINTVRQHVFPLFLYVQHFEIPCCVKKNGVLS